MTHRLMDGVHLSDMQFAPYEDVLGLGNSDGYSSIIVPGVYACMCAHTFVKVCMP